MVLPRVVLRTKLLTMEILLSGRTMGLPGMSDALADLAAGSRVGGEMVLPRVVLCTRLLTMELLSAVDCVCCTSQLAHAAFWAEAATLCDASSLARHADSGRGTLHRSNELKRQHGSDFLLAVADRTGRTGDSFAAIGTRYTSKLVEL